MRLEIKNLKKSYGKVEALKEISLEMENGIYGILGPNGAGKSTLINLLTDNVRRDGGEILLNGNDILELKGEYIKILGYMPQDQGYYEDFSVKAFLMYIAKMKGINGGEIRERVDELIDALNLRGFCHKKIGSLSGGMRQRVLLAQALLNHPKVLVLDEPTAGVDPQERINIRNIISELAEDRIIIIATHIVSDIESIANKIVLIKDGKLVEVNTPYNLVKNVEPRVYEICVKKDELKVVREKYVISNIQNINGEYKVKIISDKYDGMYKGERGMANLDDVYLYNYWIR